MSGATEPTLLETLIDRLEGRESLEVEFKSARGGLPRSIWPTISAFANTQGGWLVLGVGERDDEPVLEGISNPSGMLQQISDLLRNKNKISQPVCGAHDLSTEEIGDGRRVIVVRVPAAGRRSKPVYVDNNPYAGTYLRVQTGDYLCSKAEVDRMMREASDASTDSAVLQRFSIADLDAETLARYRRRYQTANPASPWLAYDDLQFLKAIGAYRKDRERGYEGLTVAGLLVLGTVEAIRDWRSRHLIDVRFASDSEVGDNRWDDRIVWEGNLLGAFEAIYPRLTDGQRVPFRLQNGIRIDQGPAHIAIREALVNLLVHADYAESQASLLVRSSTGYLFRNPGNSRVPTADLRAGTRSDPRNPELVRMFRFVGLAEEAGTGIAQIIKSWRELGFVLPDIDVGTERYEFALGLRHAHLLDEEDRAWLLELGGNWSEPEQVALVLARHEGEIDNAAVRELTGQHPADVTKLLAGLRSRGLLHMTGGKRGARYQLGSATMPPDLVGSPRLSVTQVGGSSANTPGAPESSEVSVPGSEGAPESSEVSVPGSEGSLSGASGASRTLEGVSQADARLRRELLAIAEPARAMRLKAPARDALIVALCARAPLSLRELAELAGRSEVSLREPIQILLGARRLAYLYPEQPTHPRQKYVAVQGSIIREAAQPVGRI